MSEEMTQNAWPIFRGNSPPHDGITRRPDPPPWRRYEGEAIDDESLEQRAAGQSVRSQERGSSFYFKPGDPVIQQINTALFLRRPLLVTGKPGTGKSSLAHAIAYELKLGQVLEWPITSRSTLTEALYRYDAIGRLQESQIPVEKKSDETTGAENAGHNKEGPDNSRPRKNVDIGRYVRLGPLGTALLPSKYPRVLLIDEIDKSDIDLPNDLLHVFEEGGYEIPELTRLQEQIASIHVRMHDSDQTAPIKRGRVQCSEFPFVVMTSNGERELPPAFLRRCIPVDIPEPTPDDLARIVNNHFRKLDKASRDAIQPLIKRFETRRELGDLATDQLLNAVFLAAQGVDISAGREDLEATVFRPLTQFRGS